MTTGQSRSRTYSEELDLIRLGAGHDAVEFCAWILAVQALLSQIDRRGHFPLDTTETGHGQESPNDISSRTSLLNVPADQVMFFRC